jgi:cytochrome P450
VQFIARTAIERVELPNGASVPQGAHVVVLLGSANRDERVFADPDRFRADRDPKGHVAFGFGAHFCLGAALARLEARVALEGLVPELGSLRRLRPEREFLDSFLIRGRARLELAPAAA